VQVNYTGWLLDGTKFDASADHGGPIEFAVGRGDVIPGWEEAIVLLNEGGKAKLIIPSELAYRDAQVSTIPAHSTLVFEVELVLVRD
jgi:FKBP-type peptidyl-prolyl cis-trans isomerase